MTQTQFEQFCRLAQESRIRVRELEMSPSSCRELIGPSYSHTHRMEGVPIAHVNPVTREIVMLRETNA